VNKKRNMIKLHIPLLASTTGAARVNVVRQKTARIDKKIVMVVKRDTTVGTTGKGKRKEETAYIRPCEAVWPSILCIFRSETRGSRVPISRNRGSQSHSACRAIMGCAGKLPIANKVTRLSLPVGSDSHEVVLPDFDWLKRLV
jgi:hypothetical protein